MREVDRGTGLAEGMQGMDRKKNIICDLDGTIALDDHRAHHLRSDPNNRNWDAYFAACDGDAPNHPVIAILKVMRRYYDIHIISGRNAVVKSKTIEWLMAHDVPVDTLTMRPEKNRMADDILKPAIAKELGLSPDNVLFVLEDRQRVVDAWRKAGYTCLQVAPGQF